MAIIADELYSLLVPLESERLVVPRSCVAEVVRYSVPDAEQEHSSWMRGSVTWNNQQIPVISFEALCGSSEPAPGRRTRVVVFNPLGGSDDCPNYGILAEGFPQMVKVNREVVVLDDGYKSPEHAPILCQINMLKERALIPDLEAIEARISAELGPDA
ncbi:MAG: chemotaxis protein CheW [Gammaproteobacteria bacterium]|jgi:chemosensory pili system protein ChpC